MTEVSKMDDLADLDFSFTCNKCAFTTKSILEIKVHSMVHKKDGGQKDNQKDSQNDGQKDSQNDSQKDSQKKKNDSTPEDQNATADISFIENSQNQDETVVEVEIPVTGMVKEESPVITEEAKDEQTEKEIDKEVSADGKVGENEIDDCQDVTLISFTQSDESTLNKSSVSGAQAIESNTYYNESETEMASADKHSEISVSVGTEVANPLQENNWSTSETKMVDTGTQMEDMGTQMDIPSPRPGPGRPATRGRGRGRGARGAAKRKAKVPVREHVQEPEEIEEPTTEEEMDVADQDYQPPGSNRILDEVNDAMLAGQRGRQPLTRSKLKGLKTKKKVAQQSTTESKRYECKSCDFSCKFRYELHTHRKEVHNEVIKKEEGTDEGDSVESDNENTLLEGVAPARRKSLGASAPDDRYTCNICNEFKCKFKKDLGRHQQEAHNIFTPQYKYVSRVANDRYKCLQCSFTCKFQRALRNHKRRVHPRPKPVIVPTSLNTAIKTPPKPRVPLDRYKCAECDFTCKFKGLLKSHRSKAHKKERPPRKLIKELECEHCGKIIRGTQHHLIRHLKTHTGEKPWECDICGAVFAEKGRLNVHKPIHNEERPWLCEECGKSFKRAINLRMHRKIHVEVKPYQCQLCAYRCTRHDTLNLHMKRKHLKLRRVLCTFCGKKFFSEKECQAHTSRKHLPRPTPFQCTLCPAAFPFAYNLRAHMKKHPEHKPFKCEYCGFESRSKASLKDHERQHTDGPNPDPEHKPFKCGYCGFESRSKAYMKDHERQHTGEKEKKCDLCDYATTTSSNLYKHRKRQHGILGMPAKQIKGRGRPPRANAFLAAQVAAVAAASRGVPVSTPPIAHQHIPLHTVQPVTLTITAEDLAAQRPQHTEEERSAETIEDGTEVAQIQQQVAVQVQHVYNKERRPTTVMYTPREKSIIGSVITEALAEARNVVQSDLYGGHIIPTSLQPTTSNAPSTLPSSTLQPVTVTHGASTFTMAHGASTFTMAHAAIPHGAVVNLPEGMIPTGIPVTAQGIPVSVAMQNVQTPGPATMFSSMMNMHY